MKNRLKKCRAVFDNFCQKHKKGLEIFSKILKILYRIVNWFWKTMKAFGRLGFAIVISFAFYYEFQMRYGDANNDDISTKIVEIIIVILVILWIIYRLCVIWEEVKKAAYLVWRFLIKGFVTFTNKGRLLLALTRLEYNASILKSSDLAYNIIIDIEEGNRTIQIQAKAVRLGGYLSFTGGARGGKDKTRTSPVKEYVQDTSMADIIVGVETNRASRDKIDFYFIPRLLIDQLNQKSLSVYKIPNAKNNWEILDKCQDPDFVNQEFAYLLTNRSRNTLNACLPWFL